MMGDEVVEARSKFRTAKFHDYLEAEDAGVAVVKFKNDNRNYRRNQLMISSEPQETLYLFGENKL